MAFQDILYAADGPVGVITLNRPRYRNAQGYRMLDEIDAAFDLARADDEVRVVLVRGSGGVRLLTSSTGIAAWVVDR